MKRPLGKHIDTRELGILVPSIAQDTSGVSPDAVLEIQFHVEFCSECSRKVLEYRRIWIVLSNAKVSEAAPPEVHCPKDVDWHEVAAGLWPELKARQLIVHAAICSHCGPLLRAATSVSDDATAEEEELLAQLTPPARPVSEPRPALLGVGSEARIFRKFLQWRVLATATALSIVIAVIATWQLTSSVAMSGTQFADFAVDTHAQYAQGSLSLEVRSDSQQAVNQWLKDNSGFAPTLPTSLDATSEGRPYRLQGARMILGRRAAYIAYQMKSGPVSLVVTPDSAAVASGGMEVHSAKLSFHYRSVKRYKVVTWSAHGLTYALVSQEGSRTQQSCMVCHSALRDRDLSQVPTPLLGSEVTPLQLRRQ